MVETTYSIAAVSKLTGVGCHALRIGERRYGFPVPSRTPSGHRRFSAEQIAQVRGLADLAKTGDPIGTLIEGIRLEAIPFEQIEQPALPEVATRSQADQLVDYLIRGERSRRTPVMTNSRHR